MNNYQLLRDAYFGSGGFASGAYLTKHKRESEDDYRFRRQNAYYLNYFAPIVNALVDPIFKHPPMRDYSGPLDDIVQDFLSDVDGSGMDIDTFMKRAAIMAKVYGVAFIIVDMERETSARNMAEVKHTRQYPYLRVVSPETVESRYGIDKAGNITHIEFKEIEGIKDGTITYRYCYYDANGWRISGETSGKTSGSYNLGGLVPVIPLFSRLLEQQTLLPNSDMMPIARTAQALYNHCSWLGEILRNQTFPLLTIPTLDAKDITIGTNNALGYSPDSSHPPDFIAPPSDPAKTLQEQIASLVQEMYRMASLSFMQSVSTAAQASGISRQWEFERTNQQLCNFARSIGHAEILILKVFQRYFHIDKEEYSVVYPDDFGIVDIEGELKEAQEVIDLGLTDDLKEEVMKKVLAAYCPDLPDERFDELIESLHKQQEDKLNVEPPEPEE